MKLIKKIVLLGFVITSFVFIQQSVMAFDQQAHDEPQPKLIQNIK